MSTITREFTKEQLIEHLRTRIEHRSGLIANMHIDRGYRDYLKLELRSSEIALASLEAEPVAWQWKYRDKNHVTNDQVRAKFVAQDGDVTVQPLYTAPPAPVVSAELRNRLKAEGLAELVKDARENAPLTADQWETLTNNWFQTFAGLSGEDYACRAAMLQGADGNSPVVTDGLNIRAVAALREAVRNQWLKSDEFAEKIYWKNMHDIANEIVVAMLAAAPQQELKNG
ncbi:hypothetical protein QCJ66_001115 [Enterobacter ludwigii]|nr:hypothetical protein [Enterobacter ludwigii]